MTAALLAVHVLAGIVFVGPVTVAASLFPRYLRLASGGDARAAGAVALLYRVSRVYAVLGVSVPVFGIATAIKLDVLGDAWLVVSIALTAGAAALLGFVVLPGQTAGVAALDADPGAVPRIAARLSMTSGIFALTWAVVVVLMIVRPGSTTGVGA